MTNRAIRDLATFFVLLFVALGLRQAYVQVIAAPQIASHPNDPRHALLDAGRGRILATDGTVLAATAEGKRTYPLGAELAQTVGYVSARYGASGIEASFDRALESPDVSGDPAAQLREIAATLQGARVAMPGADVVTTIVPAVQATLFEQLSRYPRAAGVVLDPRTGAVLGIASVPSYDPNGFDGVFASLSRDPMSPLLNRALDGLYPPGSTFKIFTAAAALDSNTVQMDSRFDDPGYLRLETSPCTTTRARRPATRSHDCVRAIEQRRLRADRTENGPETFYDYLSRWDIGGSLDFQLPASRDGVPPKTSIVAGRTRADGLRPRRAAGDSDADGAHRRDDRRRRQRAAPVYRSSSRQ